MKNFDARAYNISDFVEWNSLKSLELSPQFQRRSVWTDKAKSYLIDTIIRGKPIPKILVTQTLRLGKNIRTVVDGQQRIRAILGFIAGDFSISRAHNKELSGKTFSDLDPGLQSEFLKYEIGVDMLFDLSYEDILDVFARLNTYSVKLNSQELLNAQYLGYFKQAAYRLGFFYVRYWIDGGVVTEKQAARMAEAELASDLLGTLIDGVQSKKAIPNYYRKYDDAENTVSVAERQFGEVMESLKNIYPPESISVTNFSRVHFFHSLFSAIAHCKFGLNVDAPRVVIDPSNYGVIRNKLDEISATYDEVTSGQVEAPDRAYLDLIEATRRATTDASSRKIRVAFICEKLAE